MRVCHPVYTSLFGGLTAVKTSDKNTHTQLNNDKITRKNSNIFLSLEFSQSDSIHRYKSQLCTIEVK